jgi:hypothetical protein
MEILVDVVDVLLGGTQILVSQNPLNGLCRDLVGVSKD